MRYYQKLKFNQDLKIRVAIAIYVIAFLFGFQYTRFAFDNWRISKENINILTGNLRKSIKDEDYSSFSDKTNLKISQWKDSLELLNNTNKTFYEALRDGFFGISFLTGFATYILSIKTDDENEKKNEQSLRELTHK